MIKRTRLLIVSLVLSLVLVSTAALAQEPVQLKVVFPVTVGNFQDAKLIEAEINKIAREEINAEIELTFLRFGNYIQQTMLSLAAGEQIDLLPTVGTLSTLHAQGHLLPLNNLLDSHGQDVKELLGPDLLMAATFDGDIMAVPPLRNYAAGASMTMRKDVLDKYNIDPEELQAEVDAQAVLVDKLAVFESIYDLVKEDYPGMAPIAPGFPQNAGVITDLHVRIPTGGGFGVLMDKDSREIVNYYDTEEYKDLIKKVREWQVKGYVMRGAETNQESFEDLVKAGRAFSGIRTFEPGVNEKASGQAGTALVAICIVEPSLKHIEAVTWTIPRTSKNPEKAMEFLNLLYTSSDLQNLWAYGLEGQHYELTADGRVQLFEHSGYDLSALRGFIGNEYIQHLTVEDPADLHEQFRQFAEMSFTPITNGFKFDVTLSEQRLQPSALLSRSLPPPWTTAWWIPMP